MPAQIAHGLNSHSFVLFRRITHHGTVQNGTAITIDSVIVVAGMFIGIQVSNWNEDKQIA